MELHVADNRKYNHEYFYLGSLLTLLHCTMYVCWKSEETLYSFAATCKANGICFRTWLEEVLPRLTTTPAGLIDSLIPEAKQSSQ